MGFLKGRFALGLAVAAAAVALVSVGVVAANSFSVSSLFDFSKTGRTEHAGPTDGILSPYLVGYYDGREDADSLAEDGCDELDETCVDDLADDIEDVDEVLYLVNPTPMDLTVYIVAFDNEENPIDCTVRDLSGNDVTDVVLTDLGNTQDTLGVVKVVSFDANRPGQRVQAGLLGWVRHLQEIYDQANNGSDDGVTMSESPMMAVPTSVLMADRSPRDGQPDELSLIVDYVDSNCSPS